MVDRIRRYRFDEDVVLEMEKFGKDFLANQYKKEISENTGPNYREKILEEDQRIFEEYFDDEDFQDFLNLK